MLKKQSESLAYLENSRGLRNVSRVTDFPINMNRVMQVQGCRSDTNTICVNQSFFDTVPLPVHASWYQICNTDHNSTSVLQAMQSFDDEGDYGRKHGSTKPVGMDCFRGFRLLSPVFWKG